MSFGYKTAWFAIRTADSQAVARALGLRHLTPMPADAAITAAYREPGKVFVTPAIDGWTLAMSKDFLDLADGTPPPFMDMLRRVSAELDTEAQFFATHRVVEAHVWARATHGELHRAYHYSGSAGEKKVDLGDRTEEAALGHSFYDPSHPEAGTEAYWERSDLRFADEKIVMQIAGLWSINPVSQESMPDGFLADIHAPAAASPPTEAPSPSRKPWWQLW